MAESKRFAAIGQRPQPGEIWCPLATKSTVYALHLLHSSDVAPYVPEGFEIVSFGGRCLGVTFLSYYGPQSTLEYHELIVMPTFVRCRGQIASWVSHIYVDCPTSVAAGNEIFGLNKQLADFDWLGGRPGLARVSQDGQPLLTIQYGKGLGNFKQTIAGKTFSMLDGQALSFVSRLTAHYSLASATIDVPKNSPLSSLGLHKPFATIVGGPAQGFMGENQTTLGPLS